MSEVQMSNTHTRPGRALPLGAYPEHNGVQFSVFSRHATAIDLLIYANPDDREPTRIISFDPKLHRTGDIWHMHVPDLGEGTLYMYRAHGPWAPERGHRFNPVVPLLDPYARELTHNTPWDIQHGLAYDSLDEDMDLAPAKHYTCRHFPKCVVVDNTFDWQGDRPLNYPLRFSVIYEAHVKGLSMHPSAKVDHPGTYRGVIEMIPYLKELGITSIEFLPVQEFNQHEYGRKNPETGEQLVNYWGYNTIAFFAPKASYSSDTSPGGAVREFKEMVRELHKAGIEVILDVVFNHSGEGNETGPTISFRGLDNRVYYILEDNKRYYRNFSGTGNTFNCNHPLMRSFILDNLHYWVMDMHVDGFRFDLGSILGRDRYGNLMENPPILERIAEDPVLRNTKIIAEAWDAGGAYQVGSFPGGRWAEWNDRYRDGIRRFWKGDKDMVSQLATRITGSSDLYLRDGRKPFHSINFITSHDGFTLADLVRYNRKHNEANGEHNRDGHDHNFSFNYGIEGDSDDPEIQTTRLRVQKNFIATLMLSLGTPMLLAGDELGRSQGGNNNAYCQDTELSWINYDLMDENPGLLRFTQEMIRFRRRHLAFMRPEFFTGEDRDYNAIPDITWYTEMGKSVDWGRVRKHLALRIDGSRAEIMADRDDNDFYMMFNASRADRTFIVCEPPLDRHWHVAIDTALESPDDIRPSGTEPQLPIDRSYRVLGRSMVVLISK